MNRGRVRPFVSVYGEASMVTVVRHAGRSMRDRRAAGVVARPRWRRARSGFRESLPITLGIFGFLFAANAIDTLDGYRRWFAWSRTPLDGVRRSIGMLLSDPGWSLPFVLGAPWLALVFTPLVLVLGVTAGLRSVLRGARTADRALGAGLAVACVVLVASAFVAVPARAVPSVLVARIVVLVAGIALAPSLLFHPFREAAGAAESKTHLPSLFLWAVLVFQLDLLRTVPCWSLHSLLPGLGVPDCRLLESVDVPFAGEVWLRLALGLPLLLLPAFLVCGGATFAGAVVRLGWAWRRRPVATLGAHVAVGGCSSICGVAWIVAVASGFRGAGVLYGVLFAAIAGVAFSGALHFAARAVRLGGEDGSVASSDSGGAPLHSGPCSTSAGGTFSS